MCSEACLGTVTLVRISSAEFQLVADSAQGRFEHKGFVDYELLTIAMMAVAAATAMNGR